MPRLEEGFRRVERPAGQAPVGDNDEYGGDGVNDGDDVDGVNDRDGVVGDNDGDVGDVVDAEGVGVDENDNKAPEDTRDKGSSETDEKQKESHLYE